MTLYLVYPISSTTAVILGDLLYAAVHGFSGMLSILGAVIFLDVAIVLLFSIPTWFSLVIRVGLTDEGVTFVKGTKSYLQVPWGRLCPPEWPARFRAVTFFYKLWEPDPKSTYQNQVGPRPGPPIMVDIHQARAILAHPKCPKWDLKPEIRKSLGL